MTVTASSGSAQRHGSGDRDQYGPDGGHGGQRLAQPGDGHDHCSLRAGGGRRRRVEPDLHLGHHQRAPRAATPTFSANGSNAAKNTTATFSKAGSYTFQVTITDAGGLTATSSVTT